MQPNKAVCGERGFSRISKSGGVEKVPHIAEEREYEGEYEDNSSPHASPKKTQYDRLKGINPEDL